MSGPHIFNLCLEFRGYLEKACTAQLTWALTLKQAQQQERGKVIKQGETR